MCVRFATNKTYIIFVPSEMHWLAFNAFNCLEIISYLTIKEAFTVLFSVVKHMGSR